MRRQYPNFTDFERDDGNLGHVWRHAQDEVESAFFDPEATMAYSRRSSARANQPRWILKGRTYGGQPIVVVFTEGKSPGTVRPITSWNQ